MKEKCNRGLIVFVWWDSHLGLLWLCASTNNSLLACFFVCTICMAVCIVYGVLLDDETRTTCKPKNEGEHHFFLWRVNSSVHSSEWLTSGRKAQAWWQEEEMGNGQGVDLTWWVPMPPLISSFGIPPRTLEGGVGVGRQLKVTAPCHSTVQSHYISCRLRSCSPSSHDGQMTIIPALLFHSVSSSLGCMCFCDYVPIYILKSVKLYCW